MKITVEAKTGKKESRVEKIAESYFVVYTKEPAKENKANTDIIKQLSEYFGISRNRIDFVLGKTSKIKVFEIK